MKRIVFSAIIAFSLAGCLGESDSANRVDTGSSIIPPMGGDVLNDSSRFTTIHWIDSAKNLGSISEGQKVEIVYRFQNTGDKPLVIQSAMPSCGCTVPDKPDAPIMPGKEGSIKAVFDSKGRPGANHKTITVLTNTKGTTSHILSFQVEVVGASQAVSRTETNMNGNTF